MIHRYVAAPYFNKLIISFICLEISLLLTSRGVDDALDAHDRVLAVGARQGRRHGGGAQPRRVRRQAASSPLLLLQPLQRGRAGYDISGARHRHHHSFNKQHTHSQPQQRQIRYHQHLVVALGEERESQSCDNSTMW
jgi:hypothetical protein